MLQAYRKGGGRSVDHISTRGGAHYPHPVLQAPRIFRPCDGPVKSLLLKKAMSEVNICF